jgi:DNA-binding Lrp family transcriptional regulator
MDAALDRTDERLIAVLKQDARVSVSDLAATLGLSRATVRNRLERLQERGDIAGFTVRLKQDIQRDPVRALMMIGIEGEGTERVIRQLGAMLNVRAVHSTNGRWDVIAELGADTLEALDEVLTRIRRLDGVATSETSLLLATRKSSG